MSFGRFRESQISSAPPSTRPSSRSTSAARCSQRDGLSPRLGAADPLPGEGVAEVHLRARGLEARALRRVVGLVILGPAREQRGSEPGTRANAS